MHVIFILLPSIFTTVSMFAVLWKPSSFYVALSAAFWGSMVGIGYAMDGFIAFPVWILPGEPCLDNDHPAVKMGKVPAGQFLLAFAYLGIIVVLGFIAFGACRGRRLGKNNPDCYIHDRETANDYLPVGEDNLFVECCEKRSLLQK
jgi:hypothetical protein